MRALIMGVSVSETIADMRIVTLSVTAIGSVPSGRMARRTGVKPGEYYGGVQITAANGWTRYDYAMQPVTIT